MARVRRKFGFFHGIEVATIGTRGGLSLGWISDILVD